MAVDFSVYQIKFIYSEKATKFCEISTVYLTGTVELGNKELNCSLVPKVPYPYEVNGKLVTENGSLIPICSLSNHSLLPSLTVSYSLMDKCV